MDDVESRRSLLVEELTQKADSTGKLARRNHTTFVVMATAAVVASVVAGLLGLLEILPCKWIGAVALLPAALTLASSTLKLQTKASWYYENEAMFLTLLHKLRYEVSLPLHHDDVKNISESWSEFMLQREKVWKDTLSIDLTNLGKS